MHLNPYGEYAVLLAASLANQWPADRAGIVERARAFDMQAPFEEPRESDHADVRVVIDRWLTIVDEDAAEQRAMLLNEFLADVAAYPQLTDHDDEGWHLHYRNADLSLPYILRSVISVGTALHLTNRGMHRLGRCDAGNDPGDPCQNVVADVTRNGRQRYCSVRCANRAAVRRHRARQAPMH
ncbi:CGNR zinc finger domain-containing protein [Nocardioides sp. GXZ039]|uniref:CGNR zinc finger domain-containing protein n=1 Tax=Nocardioides sp. GXZ039 TaxID=3136018 RepID=UPI0030F3E87D